MPAPFAPGSAQPSTTLLLTGFEPFDRDTVNPSWEVARALHGWQVDRPEAAGFGAPPIVTVQAVQLRCVFGQAVHQLQQAMRETQPVLVVCLGLAGGRPEIGLERVAINVDDARIADNAGQQPIDVPVHAQGPVAYFSSLPIKAMAQALRAQGIPAAVSNSAGTFVCNHVFYALMHQLAQPGSQARGGFVHLPYLPEQAARQPGAPSMALATQVQAVRTLLQIALARSHDVPLAEGRLH